MNIAPMLSHDSLCRIQPESSSFSNPFRGEEWLKDMGSDFRCDARTVIANFYDNKVILAEGSYPQLTLPCHGVHGVLNKIGPDLIELTAKRIHQKRNRLVLAPHTDSISQFMIQNRQRSFQAFYNIHVLQPGLVQVRILPDRPHQLRD